MSWETQSHFGSYSTSTVWPDLSSLCPARSGTGSPPISPSQRNGGRGAAALRANQGGTRTEDGCEYLQWYALGFRERWAVQGSCAFDVLRTTEKCVLSIFPAPNEFGLIIKLFMTSINLMVILGWKGISTSRGVRLEGIVQELPQWVGGGAGREPYLFKAWCVCSVSNTL